MRIFFITGMALFITACSQTNGSTINTEQDSVLMTSTNIEETPHYFVLSESKFSKELIANGKLNAIRKADLHFKTAGLIKDIAVIQGQHVQAGQLIARLDDESALLALNTARLSYEQGILDYEDQLLKSGYKIGDTANLPPEMKAIARLRSGLKRASINLQQTENEMRDMQLTAPFSGTVANLKAMRFNNSSNYEYICSIIDESLMEVNFKVLEEELPFIRSTGTVMVKPFGHREGTGYVAKVQSINPLVDAGGMIAIKAVLQGTKQTELLDGMNVVVFLQQQMNKQLVVPKEAVLDRQNRKVVFTLVDSIAQWNYVEIGGENSHQYAIAKGLKAGDKVIYEGNFNLAHEKVVHGAREK